MEAQQSLKVECLKSEETLALFQDKVGKATLNSHPSIPKLAEEMASECKGLPLTLIIVGCAMKVWKSPEARETAISKMRSNPSEIHSMRKVVELLESSFDALLDTTLKSCFTYCYIFPEYKKISKEQRCIRKISLICCKDLTSLELSLSSLESLEHLELPRLESICPHASPFPSS